MEDPVIMFREKLAEILKGKLKSKYSKFPFDMHTVRDIEGVIKESNDAIKILQDEIKGTAIRTS